MLVFDAEQLRFKKMDKDEVIWRTIRGNRVPLPKYGTREEKAKAIKEWFANKNKELPKGKGRVSFYSAKVEHDQPKRSARGSGEHAQVHGDGQYTLKFAENNLENYFNKFGNRMELDMSKLVDNEWNSIGEVRAISGGRTIEGINREVDEILFKDRHQLNVDAEKIEKLKKIVAFNEQEMDDYLKNNPKEVEELTGIKNGFVDFTHAHSKFDNELMRTERGREATKEYIDRLEKQLKTFNDMVMEGKITEKPTILKVGDKVYMRDNQGSGYREKDKRFNIIQKLYMMSDEERKNYVDFQIEGLKEKRQSYVKALEDLEKEKKDNWDYHWYKRQYESYIRDYDREIKWYEGIDYKNIKSAKAQMSKVRLPASKTYLREATALNKQSPYVKNAIKTAIMEEYGVNKLREQGLGEYADEYESLIDDALHLNNVHSTGQQLETKIDNVARGFKGGLSVMPKDIGYGQKNQKLQDMYDLMVGIGDMIKYSLLAHGEGSSLESNNGRGFYRRFGNYVTPEKQKNYWGQVSSGRGDRNATMKLKKYGLSGIAYRGHGVSRVSGFVDGEGNVTFDPKKDIEVLERTTDPDVIRGWIERQKKLMGRRKKDA